MEHPDTPQPFPPIKDILRRRGIWLSKRKSQHFLQSQEVCMKIARLAEPTENDLVIEVGAGLGNLTVELAARAGKVLAVEMDRAFDDWHEFLHLSQPNANFLYDDFLKVDLEKVVAENSMGGRTLGLGNLPYQVTSSILFRFVDSPVTFDRLVFMVQKEVAERIAAGPATRSSGALTYKIALRYEATIALRISPGAFLPPPKVESAVLVLNPIEKPLIKDDAHRARVYRLLDKVFQYRRKTLTNGLIRGGFVADRLAAEEVLARANINASRRPETLSLEEVLMLEEQLESTQSTRPGENKA